MTSGINQRIIYKWVLWKIDWVRFFTLGVICIHLRFFVELWPNIYWNLPTFLIKYVILWRDRLPVIKICSHVSAWTKLLTHNWTFVFITNASFFQQFIKINSLDRIVAFILDIRYMLPYFIFIQAPHRLIYNIRQVVNISSFFEEWLTFLRICVNSWCSVELGLEIDRNLFAILPLHVHRAFGWILIKSYAFRWNARIISYS